MLSIVVVFKQYLMSCFDSCSMLFSLTSHWRSFIRRLTILLVLQYILARRNNILYAPAELNGGLLFLGFLKICPIFLGDLKIRILYVCLISCQSDLSFFWYMGEWIKSFRLVVYQRPLFCLHIYWLFWLCLFCHVCFSVKLILSGWVLSVDIFCQRKLYVQVS